MATNMITKTAGISEVFSSLQGEGTHLGERHLFIRFEHCNIHCEYCDELDKAGVDMDLDTVLKSVKKLEEESGPHSLISLTGGEPLMYQSFLKFLCPFWFKMAFDYIWKQTVFYGPSSKS